MGLSKLFIPAALSKLQLQGTVWPLSYSCPANAQEIEYHSATHAERVRELQETCDLLS